MSLIDFWKEFVYRKIFIFLFTVMSVFISTVYVYMDNPSPIYSGSVLLEMGEKTDKNGKLYPLVNKFVLKLILERFYTVKLDINKTIIVLTSKNSNKNNIEKDLKEVVFFIKNKYNTKKNFIKNIAKTEQIGEIIIGNNPINEPRKKSMIILSSITGFLLSLFIVFFLMIINRKRL